MITTLGQNPELLTKLTEWIKVFDDTPPHFSKIESATDYLSNILKNKAVLLIVDDAWETKDVEPFLIPREGCQILITTRNKSIANVPAIKEEPYKVGAMTELQALELIKCLLNRDWYCNEREEAKKVARKVGYLPLALELMAESVHEKESTWKDLLTGLNSEIAKLEEISFEDRSLTAYINLSLKILDKEHLEAFAWLGVLPEDVGVTPETASTVWAVEEKTARKWLSRLRRKALLSEFEDVFGGVVYQIHDTLHDAARNLLCNPLSPDKSGKLPGLGISFPQAQNILLERYKRKCEPNQECLWAGLPDDGYIHSHLTWHMEKAGQIEEIHKLLNSSTETGKNAWYQIQENLGQLTSYKEDVERAWRLASQTNKKNIKSNKTMNVKDLSLEAKYSLILSSFCSLFYNIPPRLLAALVKAKIKSIPYALAIIRENPSEERKTEALCRLRPYLEPYWQEAFKIARDMENPYWKVMGISAITPFIRDKEGNLYPILRSLLGEVRQIYRDNYRLRAIGNIAEHLPENEATPIFDYLFQRAEIYINSDSSDNITEILLISNFIKDLEKKDQLIKAALKKAWTMDINQHPPSMGLFGAVAKVLDLLTEPEKSNEVEKLYKLAFECKYDQTQVQALSTIIPHLPENLVRDAQEKLKNKSYRHEAQTNLAIRLAKLGHKDEALNIAHSFKDNYDQPLTLSLIAPHLSKKYDYDIFDLTLEETRKTTHVDLAYESVSNLAPYLPNVLLKKALDIVQRIKDSSKREEYIQASSLHIAKLESIEIALKLANKIEGDFTNIRTFALLLKYLEEKKQQEIVEYLLSKMSAINPEFYKLMGLARVISYLPEPYKTASLNQLIDNIKQVDIPQGGEWARQYDKVFGELSFQLASQNYLKECISIIEMIKEIPNREKAIEKVISFLQVDQVRQLLNLIKGFGRFRDNVLALISFRFADLGYLPEALGCIFSVHSDYSRIKGLKKIGDTLIKQNEICDLEKLSLWVLEKKVSSKHLVLAKLANYFEGGFKDRLTATALEIFRELLAESTNEYEKLNLCIPMIPFLFGQYKDEIIGECRNVVKNLEDSDETRDFEKDFIEELIKFLVINDCFDDTLRIIRSIEPNRWKTKAKILKSCFLSIGELPEEYKNEIVKECKSIIENAKDKVDREKFFKKGLEFLVENDLEVLQESLDKHFRAQVLEDVFFLVTRSLKYRSLKDELLTVIQSLSTISSQHLLLLELSFYIPDVVDSRKLLEITKSAVSENVNDSERVKALPKLVKKLSTLPTDLLYQAWQEISQKLSEKRREIFLRDLKFLLPIIEKLGGAKLIEETAISVYQIGKWWQ